MSTGWVLIAVKVGSELLTQLLEQSAVSHRRRVRSTTLFRVTLAGPAGRPPLLSHLLDERQRREPRAGRREAPPAARDFRPNGTNTSDSKI